MTRHRFFVPDGSLRLGPVSLVGPQAHQIARVLRLLPGDVAVLCDDSGQEFDLHLSSVHPTKVTGDITVMRPGLREPAVRITLFQGMLKGDRFELLLQKGTELGVSRFVPVQCARSVANPRGAPAERAQRWRRIVIEAAEQCGRSRLPEICAPRSFSEAVEMATSDGLAILPWEEERQVGLRGLLLDRLAPTQAAPGQVGILVGPEGGFSAAEASLARASGGVPVSLGERTLRAETAALAAIAAVQFVVGELS